MGIFEEAFIKKQLELIADKKTAILESEGIHVDEIEVHLAYQVMLKDRLGLSFGSRQMHFAILSHVTEVKLD